MASDQTIPRQTDNGLHLVADRAECRRLFSLRDAVIEYGKVNRLAASFLRSGSMAAVPFEEAQHFASDTADALGSACQAYGLHGGFVVPLPDEPRCCYRTDFTSASFSALSNVDVIWTQFIVLDENQRCALLCDDLFNTIAGPRSFVERALGMSVRDAMSQFLRDFVDEAHFGAADKQLFVDLVRYYEQVSENHGAVPPSSGAV